jgi:hypothetical protein
MVRSGLRVGLPLRKQRLLSMGQNKKEQDRKRGSVDVFEKPDLERV